MHGCNVIKHCIILAKSNTLRLSYRDFKDLKFGADPTLHCMVGLGAFQCLRDFRGPVTHPHIELKRNLAMHGGIRTILRLEISRPSAILDLTGSYFQNSYSFREPTVPPLVKFQSNLAMRS